MQLVKGRQQGPVAGRLHHQRHRRQQYPRAKLGAGQAATHHATVKTAKYIKDITTSRPNAYYHAAVLECDGHMPEEVKQLLFSWAHAWAQAHGGNGPDANLRKELWPACLVVSHAGDEGALAWGGR